LTLIYVDLKHPWLIYVDASKCEDYGYTLVREEEYQYTQKKRKLKDIWDLEQKGASEVAGADDCLHQ